VSRSRTGHTPADWQDDGPGQARLGSGARGGVRIGGPVVGGTLVTSEEPATEIDPTNYSRRISREAAVHRRTERLHRLVEGADS
jgi:hypothetical protein